MMHSTSLSIAALVVATGLAAAPAAAQTCTPKHQFTTVEAGVITVAATTYAPYSFIDEAGEVKGIDGLILAEIAKMECVKLKAIPIDPAAGIQYVISKKADVTTGDWYRTAERARVVALSAPLYLDQMAIYSKSGLDTVESLVGKTVGSTQGNLWNADLKKLLGDTLRLYPTSIAMQQDLTAGRLEMGVDGLSIGVVAQQNGALQGIVIKVSQPDERVRASLEAGQGTFPMTKDNPDMLAAFDADIKELHDNGTIAKILVQYGLVESAGETGEPRLIK